jgi:4'-phosphopantetheinyl transferase
MDTIQTWELPPAHLSLGEQEVHVWCITVDAATSAFASGQAVLTADEVAKVQRFVFERDRTRALITRALLRILAGRYLQTSPTLLRFTANPYGKPALASPGLPLQFNLSHSANLVLYAFAWQRSLGIDVEYMRTTIDDDELAEYCFSSFERETLSGLSQDEKHVAFYNCWTRKEAYIKARGLGLSLPLNLFDVSLLPGEAAALLRSREDPVEVQRWSMQQLAPGAGYAGALVVEGTDWQLRCWRWQGR